MSFIQFVQSRVAQGRMVPTSTARANRMVRSLSTQDRLAVCRPSTPSALAANELVVRSIPFRDACAFVNMHHRHLGSPVGHIFSLACYADDVLVGVAIVGRPLARMLDNGAICEVTRVATTGTRNACSKLLGAARREAASRGFSEIITYTLPDEGGSSLRAAGFVERLTTAGGAWSTPGRVRDDRLRDTRPKLRWSAIVSPTRKAGRAPQPN